MAGVGRGKVKLPKAEDLMASLEFPREWRAIERDPDIVAGYRADTLMTGDPRALARPSTVAELQEILAYCNRRGIAVTPCGGQTSMTGASVSIDGLALSVEKLSKDWRVYEDPAKPGRWLVDAGPAILLSELQDALAAKGYFYPPDPTSRGDAMLGSTIVTNASGEDTYKYGATRRWVRGLTYVRADGSLGRAERPVDQDGDGRKNTCGYPIRDSEIDLLIGSEGTLGLVVEATLEVLPRVPEFFAILFFLPSEDAALDEALALDGDPEFDLRCLEYMDPGAVAILEEKGVAIPEGAGAALYVKQEFTDDEDEKMSQWCDRLEALFARLDCPHFMERVHFAGDGESQQRLRDWRHYIPATLNERAARRRPAGGGKVSTDWRVPMARLKEMFRRVRRDQGEMDWAAFGHIGNGHPHFNFIAKDAEEYRLAREYLLAHCRLAVEMGGGVSGEHGLGKVKAHLLRLQCDDAEIQAMLAIKRAWDPNGILGPGNIFEEALLAKPGAVA